MLDSLIRHLRQYAALRDSIEVERFDATLNQLALIKDPQVIGLLLPFFDDECKFPEVMFSIIHIIEGFDDETYCRELLKSLPAFSKQSPYWATVIHFRILNSPAARNAYKSQLAGAAVIAKEACQMILAHIRKKKPQLAERCDELSTK